MLASHFNRLQVRQVMISLLLLVLPDGVWSKPQRTLRIKAGWDCHKWARGDYEEGVPILRDVIVHCDWIDTDDKDKGIRAQIWQTYEDSESMTGRSAGVLIGECNLLVEDRRTQVFNVFDSEDFTLIMELGGRNSNDFEVEKKASGSRLVGRLTSRRYSHTCFETETRSLVNEVRTFEEHFVAEGIIELDAYDTPLHKRQLKSHVIAAQSQTKAELIEVYLKGHKDLGPLLHEKNTGSLQFSIHSSPLVTLSSSLLICVWAGKSVVSWKTMAKHV